MMTDGLFDALCPAGSLPGGDQREEALASLLEAPRHMDDPRMRPYLDASFSPSAPSPDDFGALFDAVADDRSIIVVRGSDAAFSERVASGALFPDAFSRDDRSIIVVRGSDAAFSERVASGALFPDAFSRDDETLLETLPPDDVVRVRMVIEGRKGARGRFAWHGRVKEENYAHV